ncbi:BQ2448_6296 [Microbotryum intermedium]|uniref:BQ2448_6296 protein n=1 Tax=Microbotryum intermedium TaxID=269621 RepID=A0A238FRY4_9BASI|nr:BQ2448_6296 [Microbotryum intermedium]
MGHYNISRNYTSPREIWKLSRRRRFSSDPLEPITETAFEDLRASIQESKGRLVSL